MEPNPFTRFKTSWGRLEAGFFDLTAPPKPWWKNWWRNANWQFCCLFVLTVLIDAVSVLRGAVGPEIFRATLLMLSGILAAIVALAGIIILWFSPPRPVRDTAPKSALGGLSAPFWRVLQGGVLLAMGAYFGIMLQETSDWAASQAPADQPNVREQFAAQGAEYAFGLLVRMVTAVSLLVAACGCAHSMALTPAMSRIRACIMAARQLKLRRLRASGRWIHEAANPASVLFAGLVLALIVISPILPNT